MALERNIRVVVSALEGFVTLLVKKIVLDVVANLQRDPSEGGTPVDTGWARANWIPNIGRPVSNTAGTRMQAERGQLPGDSAAGVAKIALTYKLPSVVYISNNVPYILKLDAGSSKQAPKGFVRKAVIEAVSGL